MPTPYDQAMPTTLDPECIYSVCLDRVQKIECGLPAVSSLDIATLLWNPTVSLSHALEIAARVFSVVYSDPVRVVQLADDVVMNETPASLYSLWRVWHDLHSDWGSDDSLDVPVYFLYHQRHRSYCLHELGLRGRTRHLPVLKGLAGLTAGPVQPDKFRLQRFLNAMDTTLRHTVRRRLDRDQDEGYEEKPSPTTDKEAVAIEGAMKKKARGEEQLFQVMRRGGKGLTDSGQSFNVPTIPELPIAGMEDPNGLYRGWRDGANYLALKVFSSLALGHLGWLETALPDAAHAAQRAERERADAKERGGSGGHRAEKAGTAETPVHHVPVGEPDEDDEDSPYIDPADDRPNPEREVGAKEEAIRAYLNTIDRYGPSGQRMLEALNNGETDKEAAKAAGISAPALIRRRKMLIKLRDQ